jgi:hypothetical protein
MTVSWQRKSMHRAEYEGLKCFGFGKIERISDSVKFSEFLRSFWRSVCIWNHTIGLFWTSRGRWLHCGGLPELLERTNCVGMCPTGGQAHWPLCHHIQTINSSPLNHRVPASCRTFETFQMFELSDRQATVSNMCATIWVLAIKRHYDTVRYLNLNMFIPYSFTWNVPPILSNNIT